MITDLKYALRSLRKNPGFTAVAVLALALGIGANTAIFSVVSGVLLTPLPYDAPERLVRVYETFLPSGWGSVSVPNLRDWQERNHVFEYLAGYAFTSANLQSSGDPERLRTVEVETGIFPMLRAQPFLGRVFATGEDQPGAANVVLLSERLWKRRFNADPGLVGRTITLDGAAHTVAGIMPADFDFPPYSITEIWIPLKFPADKLTFRGYHYYNVMGRLKAGVSEATALAEMKSIAAEIEKQYASDQQGRSVRFDSLEKVIIGDARSRLRILLGAVGMVLLIACANIANLLLARSAGRRQELAVRASLGASRGRIIRQQLTESLVLAVLGGAAGFAIAAWSRDLLVRYATGSLPRASEIAINGTVFVFLLAVTGLAGILFGAAPALRASRVNLADALKQGGRGGLGGARDRLRQGLVIAEIALAFVLLIGAGLLMRTFYELSNTSSGMVTENVLTFQVSISPGRYDGKARIRFYDQVLERIRALPGVRSAGMITRLPIQSWGTNGSFEIEGRPPKDPASTPTAEMRVASDGYFSALGIPILRGRDLRPEDTGYLLVNKALADKYFPNEDPVGRRIKMDGPIEIAGVVGDVRQTGLHLPPQPEIYFTHSGPGFTGWMSTMTIVVSARVPPETLAGAVRTAVREVDAGQPIFLVRSLERIISDSLANRRLYLGLLGTFAGIALVLAMAGVYGVMSYVVALRTREFGLRVALGAEPAKLLRGVLAEGMIVAIIGLAVGLAGAIAVTRFLQNLLYGVRPTDPATFTGSAAVLIVVTLAACLAPALRAMRVDPMTALRDE